MILKYYPAFLDPSSLQRLIPWDFSKQIPEEATVCSPEVQGCDLTFCPAPSSQDPELHHLTVTITKVPFDLHILSEAFLICEYEVQQSTSPHWLLFHLCQEIIINALQ